MTKVALCIPSLVMGGAERFVVDLARMIDKKKYEVQVIITRNGVKTQLWNELRDNDIEIIDVSDNNFFRMTKNVFMYFITQRPSVVHANVGSMLHIMLAAKLARIPKKLYTVHNEAKLLFGNSKFKKMIYKSAFLNFGFVPIAICDTVKKTLINEFSLKSEYIPCVKNGVDINKFRFERMAHHKVRIISVGSLYQIKNHQAIIDAFAELYSENKELRLLILGEGVQREFLEGKIDKYNLKEVVSLPGIKKDVASYLQASDIYVSASLTEGLPLSILEAMSCGLPVVATNAGGTVDIVKNNVNGIIVSRSDSKELKNALEKLLNNDDLRERFGTNSRNIAIEWSLENCARGYEKLYER